MDIFLGRDGDIKLTSKGDIVLKNSIAQKIRLRLSWLLGEWRWNKEVGLDYFSSLLIKNPNISECEQMVKREILNVPEVISANVEIAYSRKTRKGVIKFIAYTTNEIIREEVDM